MTLPLAAVALVMAVLFVPSHVNEGTEPVDNLGGLLSVVLVAALILAINFAPVPNAGTLALGLALIAAAALVAFYLRQRRAKNPLYDLDVAARPTFWVAACAGIIVFGSLMGAMFIGQQFLQNVLDYSTLRPERRSCPAAVCMVLIAPRSAKLVEARGARLTLLVGYGSFQPSQLYRGGLGLRRVRSGRQARKRDQPRSSMRSRQRSASSKAWS